MHPQYNSYHSNSYSESRKVPGQHHGEVVHLNQSRDKSFPDNASPSTNKEKEFQSGPHPLGREKIKITLKNPQSKRGIQDLQPIPVEVRMNECFPFFETPDNRPKP